MWKSHNDVIKFLLQLDNLSFVLCDILAFTCAMASLLLIMVRAFACVQLLLREFAYLFFCVMAFTFLCLHVLACACILANASAYFLIAPHILSAGPQQCCGMLILKYGWGWCQANPALSRPSCHGACIGPDPSHMDEAAKHSRQP